MDATNALAMLLRILETGRSSASRVAARSTGSGLAGWAAGAAPGLAFSTSSLTMRPPGPEPWMVDRSMPLSAAIFLASGEALMRSPVEAVGAAGAGVGSATGAAGAGSATLGWGAAGAASLGASAAGALSTVGASSPFSPIAAMAPPTGTSSPTPQYCLIKTPSSKHSTSIVALSVSTSAIMSPLATASPSFFNHLTSVPTVMV